MFVNRFVDTTTADKSFEGEVDFTQDVDAWQTSNFVDSRSKSYRHIGQSAVGRGDGTSHDRYADMPGRQRPLNRRGGGQHRPFLTNRLIRSSIERNRACQQMLMKLSETGGGGDDGGLNSY